MERTAEIQKELLEGLAAQERALQEDAHRCKERLDSQLEEQAKAKAEYPELMNKLEAKKKLSERLAEEIGQLEVTVAVAENSLNDDGVSALSRIARSKQDWQRAKDRAETFVTEKIKQLTR